MNKQTIIISVTSNNPNQSITVENDFKIINLVPNNGGTTVTDVVRDYSKFINKTI